MSAFSSCSGRPPIVWIVLVLAPLSAPGAAPPALLSPAQRDQLRLVARLERKARAAFADDRAAPIPVLRRALAILRDVFGVAHPRVEACLEQIAWLCYLCEDFK